MKLTNILISTILLSANRLLAQDVTPVEQIRESDSNKTVVRGFLLTGNGFVNFEKAISDEKPAVHGALYPIILCKPSYKFIFETEAAIEIEENKIKSSIEYATLHYVLSKYITLSAGKFLSPFGTYAERLHPEWINKFPEAPPGFSHDGTVVGPMSEIGLEIRGGAPVGSSKINYAVYLSNGPELITDSGDSTMTGMLEYGNLKDNNKNKAFGGRLGFLPFPNSSLEVGISRQDAKVGNEDDSIFSNAKAAMHAFDMSYVKVIPFLKSIIDFKGQYNYVMIDKNNNSTSGMDTMASVQDLYSVSKAFYSQVACRPALAKSKVLQNMEFCARYSLMESSIEGMSDENTKQFAIGLNYWFSWRSVFKISYLVTKKNGGDNESILVIQLAIAHPKINLKKKK